MAIQTQEILRRLWSLRFPAVNTFITIPVCLYAMTYLFIYAVNIGDPLTSVESEAVVRGLLKDYWFAVFCSFVLQSFLTAWMRHCGQVERDTHSDA